ncbi:MAG: hypothetical protein IPI44_15000 [Sulfuritalea sp.]|nr:hypothetical protein [Sulfuritalea sp.]
MKKAPIIDDSRRSGGRRDEQGRSAKINGEVAADVAPCRPEATAAQLHIETPGTAGRRS